MHILLTRVSLVAGAFVVVGQLRGDGQTNQATARVKRRCVVTGSNVPKRDCRHDVEKLPPGAVEALMPVLPEQEERRRLVTRLGALVKPVAPRGHDTARCQRISRARNAESIGSGREKPFAGK